MRKRTIAYGIYMGLSILISLTIASVPAIFLFLILYESLDPFLINFIWPFGAIAGFFEGLLGGLLPPFVFGHFWFLVFLIPIALICYSIFLGILFGMFRLSQRGIPYLESGYHSQESEDWLLYEFHNAYYLLFPYFAWFFSIFFESKVRHTLFGAKIGKGTIIGNAVVLPPDRIVLGDNCLIGYGAILCGHVYEGDRLYLNTLTIGNNVTVGGYAILFPGAKIGDNVIIGANTVVPKDRTIPPNTIWVHGKAIPRKDLEFDEEEYKALAEETGPEVLPPVLEDEDAEIPTEGEHI